MKAKAITLALTCLALTACSPTGIATKTNFDFPTAKAQEKFTPKYIPEFDKYLFRNTDQTLCTTEFKLYKDIKVNAAMSKEEVQHIRESERIVEPGAPITLEQSVTIFDNAFDCVGEATPGTYVVIGLYDEWVHIADKTGQAAWCRRDSVSVDSIVPRTENTTSPELAMSELETIEWTPDITVLKDSIRYVFPEGNFTFTGKGKRLTIQQNNVVTDELTLDEPYEVSLSNKAEVYADFGTGVKSNATLSANMVTQQE